jgi:acyl-CoA reductase-like NAD-dependent aldehyde dehydrogenase
MTLTALTKRGFFVAGEEQHGDSVDSVRNPFNGDVVGEVALAGGSDVEHAVDKAVEALRRRLAPFQRADVLDEAARLLGERRDDVANLISAEVGKPISLARGEVDRAVNTLQFSAAAARDHAGRGVTIDAAPSGVGKIAYTMSVPVGVVAAITPFNFPLNLVAHKLGPAIAAGCPVVLKPAPQAPLTALAFAQILFDAGLPGDFLSVLPGSADDIGQAILHDDRIAAITFTGSTKVGWFLRQSAPRKKVLLELGNSAPVIVHADADLQLAAAKLTMGAFAFAGQSCVSVQRVYAHRDVVEELSELVLERTNALGVGDPSDAGVVVGPVIDQAARTRLTSWIGDAIDSGAGLLTGGTSDGQVVAPTVLTEVPADSPLEREEAFGPVFGITAYDDIKVAFARANDTRFALQAAIFTSDLRLALDATKELAFGGVLVNEAPTFRTDGMPYGGGGDSGNTKEGPSSTVEELTDERLVIFDHSATPVRSVSVQERSEKEQAS